MIRSMLLGPNLPFPTRGGPDLRAWQMVNALVELGTVGVFGLRHESSRRPADDRIAMWRSGSDDRLLSTDSLLDLSWMAEGDGLPSSRYYSERVASEISDSVRAFRPEVVVVEGIWLARYLDVVSDVPSVVLDAHNVETALHREIAAAQRNPAARLLHTEFARRVALLEEATFAEVDQVWVCSDADERAIGELSSEAAPVRVVQNGVEVGPLDPPDGGARVGRLDYGERAAVFTGQFSYQPNQVAARCLIDEVFPDLGKSFADARLLLVGRFPTDEMAAAAQHDDRIVVTGSVADTLPYLRAASVMAVPLFQGGGTRFKILEAFAAGLPVVTTPKGAEGIDVSGGMHVVFGNDAAEIGEGIAYLWRDSSARAELVSNAHELVRLNYSWEAVAAAVAAALEALLVARAR
jgi:glycosyltransferase involved in cell wall biosynthesis